MDQLLVKLLEYLSNAEVFIRDEIPDVLQQMIRYDFYYYVLLGIFCSVIFTCFTYLIFDDLKEEMKKHIPDTFGHFFLILVICLPSFFGLWICAINATKITIAPKYYLIERVTELVRHK